MDTLPAAYTYCVEAYQLMEDNAVMMNVRDTDLLVWEGFTTKLITDDLHLSVPYYSKIMNYLKNMGCVEQLRRGGSTSPSQWILHFPPTEEAFRLASPETENSQKATKVDALEQRIKDLNKRLSDAGL